MQERSGARLIGCMALASVALVWLPWAVVLSLWLLYPRDVGYAAVEVAVAVATYIVAPLVMALAAAFLLFNRMPRIDRPLTVFSWIVIGLCAPMTVWLLVTRLGDWLGS